MIVKAYYEGGRIDVFDTDHMTEPLPQKGNLLTNYAVDLGGRDGGGIWLRSYYHEAAEAYRETVGPEGLPVARRRDGWSFLIADAGDIKALDRLTVDDEVVIARMGGELVDAGAVRRAYEASAEIAPMAQAAYQFAFAQLRGVPGTDAVQEACDKIGVSYECLSWIASALSTGTSESRDRDL